MLNIINSAFAQEAAAAADKAQGSLMAFLPLILIFAVFYFLIIRPQNKRLRDHQDMLKAVKAGDEVVTTGGIIGRVVSVDDASSTIRVEIADGVRVLLKREMLAEIRDSKEVVKAKEQPVPAKKAPAKKTKKKA